MTKNITSFVALLKCSLVSCILDLITVPQPRVEVTAFPGGVLFYAGSELTLRCSIEIDVAVDIPFTVSVTWLKSGSVISSNDRTAISNVTQLSPYIYEGSLVLDPLSSTSDTGIYMCQVAVSPVSAELLVQGVSQAGMETVTVQGKIAYCTDRALETVCICSSI